MKSILIWSTNSLEENYSNIVFVRTVLHKNGWEIKNDWIHNNIQLRNNIPHFLEVQGYDYLKVGIDGISTSDLIIFFFTKSSSYLTTLLKYAYFNKKKIIIIYKTRAIFSKIDIDLSKVTFVQVKSITKFNELINEK